MNEKERLRLEEELLMTCSKAQAINKYIDELEESAKLSELWCKSQQENQQLKDNWNELKKYAKENLYFYSGLQGEDLEEDLSIKDILDKMQELEGELE